MREKLIRSDKVECVIGLGANLFYNSPMEACIMICRMTKRPERRGQVLFINAVNEVERKNAQVIWKTAISQESQPHTKAMPMTAFCKGGDDSGYCRQ